MGKERLRKRVTRVPGLLLGLCLLVGCGSSVSQPDVVDLEGNPETYETETVTAENVQSVDRSLSYTEAKSYAVTVLGISFDEAEEIYESREPLPELSEDGEPLDWVPDAAYCEYTTTREKKSVICYDADGKILYDAYEGMRYGYREDGTLAYTEENGRPTYYVSTSTGDGKTSITQKLFFNNLLSFECTVLGENGLTDFKVTCNPTDYDVFAEVFSDEGGEESYRESGISVEKLTYGWNTESDDSMSVTLTDENGTTILTYDEDGKQTGSEVRTSEGGSIFRTVDTFDRHGNLESEETYCDDVLTESIQYLNSYSPGGDLLSVEIYEDETLSEKQIYNYTYDGRNRLIGLSVTDENGAVLREIERIYRD